MFTGVCNMDIQPIPRWVDVPDGVPFIGQLRLDPYGLRGTTKEAAVEELVQHKAILQPHTNLKSLLASGPLTGVQGSVASPRDCVAVPPRVGAAGKGAGFGIDVNALHSTCIARWNQVMAEGLKLFINL